MKRTKYRRQRFLRVVAVVFLFVCASFLLDINPPSVDRGSQSYSPTKTLVAKVQKEAVGLRSLRIYQHFAKLERNKKHIEHLIMNTSFRKNSESNIFDEGMNRTIPFCDGSLKVSRTDLDVDGGYWSPLNCMSRSRVAILIPFRDRYSHLSILLRELVGVLKRQQLEFHIFVAEQVGNGTFNKGRLMNAGYKEALKLFPLDCVIFHDVDLIPENDQIPYSCQSQPTHLSVAIDEMDYKLKYDLLVGGVLNMRRSHFELVNGYSNEYWGWGAEDDDMAYRILLSNLRILRPPSTIARYKMVPHRKQKPSDWQKRKNLLRTVNKRFQLDGLNNVPYNRVGIQYHKLYTLFQLDIGHPYT